MEEFSDYPKKRGSCINTNQIDQNKLEIFFRTWFWHICVCNFPKATTDMCMHLFVTDPIIRLRFVWYDLYGRLRCVWYDLYGRV